MSTNASDKTNMAAIRSLGVHNPSALPYLIGEGILPAEPLASAYKWETYNDGAEQGLGEEEILSTEYCVVYSTGGIVRKVFSFGVEEQKVQHAVLTWFSSEDDGLVPSKKRPRGSFDSPEDATGSERSTKAKASLTTSLAVRQKPGFGVQTPDATLALKGSRVTPSHKAEDKTRALVVFLKFQAHVFFIRGSSHVVNLPFEVERAFPAPRGLILQRRLPSHDAVTSTPIIPSAPQNSFLSPEALQARRKPQAPAQARSRKSKERSSGGSRASFALEDLVKSTRAPSTDDLPRHYSFTDPLSDMGLVVCSSNTASIRQSNPLSNDEEILYVSPSSEVLSTHSKRKPLIFLVTANQARKVYSIYTSGYIEQKSLAATMNKRSTSAGTKSRRRSSFVPGTGATTPAVRARDQPRESIGGNARPVQTQGSSTYQTAEETFASQLDPDFDPSRQPAKESRRVSSLLSRVDISTNHDRSTFQDMASSHNPGPSFARRGPSLGAATSRTSFGVRKSYHRASTPGSILSRQSLGYSSDEEAVDDLRTGGLSVPKGNDDSFDTVIGNGLPASPFREPFDGLRKEFLLQKLTEIPMDKPGSFSSWTKAELLHRPRIFVVAAPTTVKSLTHDSHRLCLHIVQPHTHDHIEVFFTVHKIPPSSSDASGGYVPIFERSRRIQGDLDATKVTDGGVSRILSLKKAPSGDYALSLRTCWAERLPATTIPIPPLTVFNPFMLWDTNTPSHRTTGRRRTLDLPKDLVGFSSVGSAGSFDVLERGGRRHRLQVQLKPKNPYHSTTLQMCILVLPEDIGDTLLACWWELCKRIDDSENDKEWTALVTSLLALGVGRVRPPANQGKAAKLRAGSRVQRRESSSSVASTSDSEAMQLMWERLQMRPGAKFWTSPAWSWCFERSASKSGQDWKPVDSQSDFVTSCIARARTFLSSETGSTLLSPLYDRGEEGKHDLPRVLIALHLLREEHKLNILCNDRSGNGTWDVAPLLAQLGRWLDWEGWWYSRGGYYALEGASESSYQFEDSEASKLLNSV